MLNTPTLAVRGARAPTALEALERVAVVGPDQHRRLRLVACAAVTGAMAGLLAPTALVSAPAWLCGAMLIAVMAGASLLWSP